MNWELAISAVTLLAVALTATTAYAEAPLHTRAEFSFTVDAPFAQVAPLFGADQERKWATGWSPTFLYPIPARDQHGMVFTVPKAQLTSVWVNTAFDLAAGHIQYVYVLDRTMTTLIDIHLTRASEQKTGVNVVYERTALLPAANEQVQRLANEDAGAGKEWSEAINGYFAKARAAGPQK